MTCVVFIFFYFVKVCDNNTNDRLEVDQSMGGILHTFELSLDMFFYQCHVLSLVFFFHGKLEMRTLPLGSNSKVLSLVTSFTRRLLEKELRYIDDVIIYKDSDGLIAETWKHIIGEPGGDRRGILYAWPIVRRALEKVFDVTGYDIADNIFGFWIGVEWRMYEVWPDIGGELTCIRLLRLQCYPARVNIMGDFILGTITYGLNGVRELVNPGYIDPGPMNNRNPRLFQISATWTPPDMMMKAFVNPFLLHGTEPQDHLYYLSNRHHFSYIGYQDRPIIHPVKTNTPVGEYHTILNYFGYNGVIRVRRRLQTNYFVSDE